MKNKKRNNKKRKNNNKKMLKRLCSDFKFNANKIPKTKSNDCFIFSFLY